MSLNFPLATKEQLLLSLSTQHEKTQPQNFQRKLPCVPKTKQATFGYIREILKY